MAGLGGAFEKVAGNETLQQIAIWQILGTILSAALAPALQAITNAANGAAQEVPLSPADLALGVLRNVFGEEEAAKMAAMSGVSPANFHTLTLLTGDSIGPQQAAVALRRGYLTPEQYDLAIRQSRLRDEYAPVVQKLAIQQPSPVDILQAYLEGQIGEAEARTKYQALGGDPDYFDLEYHTRGSSPSPVEAGRMAHRGIIGWTGQGPDVVSYEQAFLEGPWRNKWSGPMQQLSEYLPPPRTVTAMQREGSLTPAQALDLYKKAGLSDTLAQAYLDAASHGSTAGPRTLSESIVHALYTDQLIDAAEATKLLEQYRYTAEEAAYYLKVWDFEVAARMQTSAARKIGTLYVGHKLDKATALKELSNLAVPSAQAQKLLDIWSIEREANVAILTRAQIAAAFKNELMDEQTALSKLQQLGYSADDAKMVLELAVKEPLSVYEQQLAAQAPATPAGGTTGG